MHLKTKIVIDGWQAFEIRNGSVFAANLDKSTNSKLIPPWEVRQKLFEEIFKDKPDLATLDP